MENLKKKGGGIKPNINMHFGRCADLKAEKTRIWNDESLKEALSCVLTRLIIKPSIVLSPSPAHPFFYPLLLLSLVLNKQNTSCSTRSAAFSVANPCVTTSK